MSAENLAYAIYAGTLAITFWTAAALLILASRASNHWLRRFGLVVVCVNAALFWTTALILRVMGAPAAELLNMWSRVSYGLLAFYALGFGYMHWRPPLGRN